jgi:hypothetical protein
MNHQNQTRPMLAPGSDVRALAAPIHEGSKWTEKKTEEE